MRTISESLWSWMGSNFAVLEASVITALNQALKKSRGILFELLTASAVSELLDTANLQRGRAGRRVVSLFAELHKKKNEVRLTPLVIGDR